MPDYPAALSTRLLAALSDRGARCVLARKHKLVLPGKGPAGPSGLCVSCPFAGQAGCGLGRAARRLARRGRARCPRPGRISRSPGGQERTAVTAKSPKRLLIPGRPAPRAAAFRPVPLVRRRRPASGQAVRPVAWMRPYGHGRDSTGGPGCTDPGEPSPAATARARPSASPALPRTGPHARGVPPLPGWTCPWR